MNKLRLITTKPKGVLLLFLGIYILAIFLRTYRLGSQGLFFDEAHAWLTSQYPLNDLVGILRFDNQVPFTIFCLKYTF